MLFYNEVCTMCLKESIIMCTRCQTSAPGRLKKVTIYKELRVCCCLRWRKCMIPEQEAKNFYCL